MPKSSFARVRGALFLALGGAFVASGVALSCRAPKDSGDKEQLAASELEDLIARRSTRPVVALGGEDPFPAAPLQEESEADPFALAARRFADPIAAEPPDPQAAAAGASQEGAPALDASGNGAEPAAALPAAVEGAPSAPALDPLRALPPQEPARNPYLAFGKRIVVHGDGRITKPYPLRLGTGQKLRELLLTYGNVPPWDPQSGPQGLDTVHVDLREGWDIELYSDLRKSPAEAPRQQPLADWLIVTGAASLLEDVEHFINIFAAGIPQIEIEAKIVEVRTQDSLEFGVRQVSSTQPIFGFPGNTLVDSFTYDFPISRAGGILTLGAVQDGFAFNAVIEALARYENVSIISRPKIAVREGGRAEIVSLESIPFYNITGLNSAGDFGATLTYQEVGVRLFVVPWVVGTETVALNIDVEASQESGSSVTFNFGQGQLQNPIITRRSAKTIVYLEPGQAVILGGLITERTVEDQQKIPLLGDIPILGNLFKSTRKQNEQTNVLFFIRPRILTGTDMHRDF